jgi:hypothetical protein
MLERIFASGLGPGLRGERRAVVTQTMATTHAGGPGVLMAAWMILEMELAAQDSTDRFLPEGYTTVGYEICVRRRSGKRSLPARSSSKSTAASSCFASRRTISASSSARAPCAARSSARAPWDSRRDTPLSVLRLLDGGVRRATVRGRECDEWAWELLWL